MRPCHLHHASDPAVSTRTDPLTGTILQRCGETRTRGTDIKELCPPRLRRTHGHAAPGWGSSGFSADLVSLPAIYELPLDDSSGDADYKVDAHPPCPIQIGVCPQSRQPPDTGTPASQLTAVGHTQDCAATRTAAVIPHHFLDAENAFLTTEEDPTHSLWAGCSEPSARTHNTNAATELSTRYGTSATLGQHKACPDRDDSERTRPVTTTSASPLHDLSPPFVPLELAYAAYDASLTYISDDVVLFWHPPSAFSQWTLSPFTVDLVEYNCAEQFMMASKARLFGDDTMLSAILTTKDPREQKRLGRHVRLFDPELWRSECEHIVLHGNLAKFSQNEEMHLALIQTGDRRLAEASPHDALWGIDLSAHDPRASSPGSWCGQNLLGQALENAREILRRDIPVPPPNPTPETPVPCAAGDTVFEVDPVTHLRLETDPLPANTQSAMLFASTASVPDDHAPEVLLAQEQRFDAPPSYLNKDLTSSAASSPWTTSRSPPCYHSTAESPRRLDLAAAPFWTRARLNRSSIKEPLTKWSPWVPLTRLASDPPHPELGAGSDPDSCSARTNRPE